MSDIVCITNRRLCKTDFLERLELIAKNHPAGIILREKDLSEMEYKELARQVMEICRRYEVSCVLHSFVDVAIELECDAIHLPLPVLRKLTKEQKCCFRVLGASCHSVEEAQEAEALGCTYIIAGHIFETDCKKGLEGRGPGFLRNVCESCDLPVYAIGGIGSGNMEAVRNAGAAGGCVMSGVMQCENVWEFLKDLNI